MRDESQVSSLRSQVQPKAQDDPRPKAKNPRPILFQNIQRQMRAILPGVIDALSGFLEIGLTRFVNVDKLLWIAIDEREPGALYLHHDSVANLKRVVHVRHCELNLRYLVGNHCLGLFKTV